VLTFDYGLGDSICWVSTSEVIVTLKPWLLELFNKLTLSYFRKSERKQEAVDYRYCTDILNEKLYLGISTFYDSGNNHTAITGIWNHFFGKYSAKTLNAFIRILHILETIATSWCDAICSQIIVNRIWYNPRIKLRKSHPLRRLDHKNLSLIFQNWWWDPFIYKFPLQKFTGSD